MGTPKPGMSGIPQVYRNTKRAESAMVCYVSDDIFKGFPMLVFVGSSCIAGLVPSLQEEDFALNKPQDPHDYKQDEMPMSPFLWLGRRQYPSSG